MSDRFHAGDRVRVNKLHGTVIDGHARIYPEIDNQFRIQVKWDGNDDRISETTLTNLHLVAHRNLSKPTS